MRTATTESSTITAIPPPQMNDNCEPARKKRDPNAADYEA
jgi:hypothetical protein